MLEGWERFWWAGDFCWKTSICIMMVTWLKYSLLIGQLSLFAVNKNTRSCLFGGYLSLSCLFVWSLFFSLFMLILWHKYGFHTLLKEVYAVFGNLIVFLPWSYVYELLLSLLFCDLFIFTQQWASLIASTATRRKLLARWWTWLIIYYWMNYELLIIIFFIKPQAYNYCVYYLHGLIGSALDHRSLPPVSSNIGMFDFVSLTLLVTHLIWPTMCIKVP